MKINKKWRLLLIPVILGLLTYSSKIYLNKPYVSDHIFQEKTVIKNKSKYIVKPQKYKPKDSIEFEIHIQSYEDTQAHKSPLKERSLLTINEDETSIPNKIKILSQDEYHIKAILLFPISEITEKIKKINISIFDHTKNEFNWTLE